MTGKSLYTTVMRMRRFLIIEIVLFSVFAGAISSRASDELPEYFRSALSALQKNPSAADAEAHLIRVFTFWNEVGPEPVTAVLSRYATDKRASLNVRSRARFLSAIAQARLGNKNAAAAQIAKMGFIEDWVHIGPFSNVGGAGFDTEYPPEKEPVQDPDAAVLGKERSVYWRTVPKEAVHMGMVHLEALSVPADNTCGYAKTVFKSTRAGTALLQAGAGGVFKAFWNGEEALRDDVYRTAGPDRSAALVAVRKGDNTLLFKVCTEEIGNFGFYARLTDRRGRPIKGSFEKEKAVAVSASVSSTKAPKPLPGPIQILSDKKEKHPDDPKAQSAAARYLYFTQSGDLNTGEVRDMAKKACKLKDNAEDCLLWAVSALDRSEQQLALEKARQIAPKSEDVYTASAEWTMEGPEPARALPFIEQALEINPDSPRAAMLKAAVMGRRGFARTAYAQAEALVETHPSVPALIDFARYSAEAAGSMVGGERFMKKGAAFNFDEAYRHTELAEAALARGDLRGLEQHISDMLFAAPHDDDTYVKIAALREGAGQTAQAEAALRRRLVSAPENADAMTDLGMFLMREQRKDEAVDLLTRALDLRPQDAKTAEYLQYLGPVEPMESSFIIPDTVFLSPDFSSRGDNRKKLSDESEYLVDQTVVEMYGSGLASRFRQIVFRIGNRTDAKNWRVRDIQYLPNTQQLKILAAKVHRKNGDVDKIINRGTVSISEPWYRLYYDVAAEVLEFPSLEPGDTVEISYRIDDVTAANIFNDYFGDFAFIEETTPKRFWRYVVIAPKTRQLRFNQPTYPLKKTVEETKGTKTYFFEARDIPRLRREAGMPGTAEIAAYFHVSTYKSWKDLGQWYKGLIRHQTVSDSRIRAKVKELVRGKKTTLEKVRAIYDWVVSAVRYVGLEFGIHGYKPYRAPLVVSRGFGDCKDKASLLVTMLREANIKAEFVLIRTKDLGLLSTEPASLSVFNHAIAYVPSLDIYLDGTAENHGIFELPSLDQGAFALILKDTGATPVTTPVLPASKNHIALRAEIVLDTKGNGVMTADVSVQGKDAAALRRGLETRATRNDRFEASLAAVYPGTSLDKLDISSLSNPSEPVAYGFSASIPSLATLKGERLEMPADEGLGLVSTYAKLPIRQYDLTVGPPRIAERAVKVAPPPGYEPVDLPKSTNLSTPFGALSFQVTKQGDTVETSRRFEISADRVSPEDYPKFVDFVRKVDEALSSRLVFRRKK